MTKAELLALLSDYPDEAEVHLLVPGMDEDDPDELEIADMQFVNDTNVILLHGGDMVG